jgi:hypothetical protein
MDVGLVKMMVAAMGFGIPFLASAVWGITHTVLKHRRKTMELEAAMVTANAAQFAAQTELLEQRMRVMERIVTDRGIVVADEIASLREKAA